MDREPLPRLGRGSLRRLEWLTRALADLSVQSLLHATAQLGKTGGLTRYGSTYTIGIAQTGGEALEPAQLPLIYVRRLKGG